MGDLSKEIAFWEAKRKQFKEKQSEENVSGELACLNRLKHTYPHLDHPVAFLVEEMVKFIKAVPLHGTSCLDVDCSLPKESQALLQKIEKAEREVKCQFEMVSVGDERDITICTETATVFGKGNDGSLAVCEEHSKILDSLAV